MLQFVCTFRKVLSVPMCPWEARMCTGHLLPSKKEREEQDCRLGEIA